MARRIAKLEVEVEYDANMTDDEALASAFDQLMETILSTPGILDEYGRVDVGAFYVAADRGIRRKR